MSSLSYVTTAGSRRKRKNAVDMNLYEVVDKGPRGKGRPSKGGAALRAKRYYVKNHLMVLEKRKLKRYVVKVRKHIDENKYDSATILTKLTQLCKTHIRRNFYEINESQLLYFVNLSREDQYLKFLNDEGQSLMDSLFKKNPSDIPCSEKLQQLQTDIMKKHSMLLFQVCTLLSAYLLVHHVENLLQNETFESDEQRLEKMKSECLALYVVRYDHIIAAYKDDEYHQDDESTKQDGAHEGDLGDKEEPQNKETNSECRLSRENSSMREEPATKKSKTEILGQ